MSLMVGNPARKCHCCARMPTCCLVKVHANGQRKYRGSTGNQYLFGFEPPHYPVPAIQGKVHLTSKGVYIADPQGYDCVALWSKKYGTQTI